MTGLCCGFRHGQTRQAFHFRQETCTDHEVNLGGAVTHSLQWRQDGSPPNLIDLVLPRRSNEVVVWGRKGIFASLS